jgi:hypothetical protein
MHVTPAPARFLLTAGLLLTIAGGSLWALEATVVDRDRVVAHADEILHQGPVRTALATRLANALVPPDPDPPDDQIGQPSPALPLAEDAVAQPQFTRAFAGALALVHAHVVDGSTAPLALDPHLVGEAVAEARGGAPVTPVAITLDESLFPRAHDSLSRLELAAGLLLALGVALVVAGLVTGDHRARAVMRIGRWAIVTGAVTVLATWALPTLVLEPLGGWSAVTGIVIGTADWLAPVAGGLVVFGGALVLGGHLWDSRGRRRTLAVIPRRQGRRRDPGWAGPA